MKILVAYDGSREAGAALEWAATIGKGLSGEITVIGVARALEATAPIADAIDPSSDLDVHRQQLAAAAARLAEAGFAAQTVLRAGNPAEEILDAAEAGAFELVVIGHHGMGAARRFLMGSVSERVVRHASLPVLVVR